MLTNKTDRFQISLAAIISTGHSVLFDSNDNLTALTLSQRTHPIQLGIVHYDHLLQDHQQNNSIKPIDCSNHQFPVIAMAVGHKTIVTVSKDDIISWKLDDQTMFQKIGKGIDQVSFIKFNSTNEWVAVCTNTDIYAIHVDKSEMICFQGHNAKITACEFSSYNVNQLWLISVSEDRSFKSNHDIFK